MNFDKESKSKDFFLWGGGVARGGGGGGGKVDFRPKKTKTKSKQYIFTFCAHALYKISNS